MHLTAGRDTNHDRNGSHRLNALRRERFHISAAFLEFLILDDGQEDVRKPMNKKEKPKSEEKTSALLG